MHDARRAGRYPMPQQTIALMAEAATLEPAVALRRFVENALAPATVAEHPELVDGSWRTGWRAPQPAGWAAQAAAGATFDAFGRLGALAAPALVQHGDRGRRRRLRETPTCSSSGFPDARLELFPGAGHLFFWEAPERFVALGLRVPGGA